MALNQCQAPATGGTAVTTSRCAKAARFAGATGAFNVTATGMPTPTVALSPGRIVARKTFVAAAVLKVQSWSDGVAPRRTVRCTAQADQSGTAYVVAGTSPDVLVHPLPSAEMAPSTLPTGELTVTAWIWASLVLMVTA